MSRISPHADGTVVHLEPWDSLDAAFVRFKKKCVAAQIFQELKKRAAYLPPAVRRRAKSQRAAQRRARAARRQLENGRPDAEWKPEPAADRRT